MKPELQVRNLAVHYGDLIGIADVSLDVPGGSIVALIGSNGAGKTTTLNAIAGLIAPASGSIRWQDQEIGRLPAYAVVARGLALSPEGWRLFVNQTVEQNLRLGATVLRDRRKIPGLLDRVFTFFPRLAERRRQRAGTLSGGERQMLAMGRALMCEPKLLLLDEPSLGLAPAVVEALYETLAALHKAGMTMLLAEQSVELALEIAQHAYVLQTGRTVLDGPAANLAEDPEVQRIYLGLETKATKVQKRLEPPIYADKR
jgi:branched-chain amino acid transport system ATP-binding protein